MSWHQPKSFATTRWSLVAEAGGAASPECRAALSTSCELYWYPLYAFVRRKGYQAAEAQALQTTEGAVKAAAHRLRKRCREMLREEIAQTVFDPGEIDETRSRLPADQLRAVNQILGDAHRAYLEIEKENITQTHNAAGHWATTVNIQDANQLAEVENRPWTKIDAVVDVSWQNVLRFSLSDLKSPNDVGVLGCAGRQGTIEIWKVGSWYHWKVTPTGIPPAEDGIADGPEPSSAEGSRPQLPIRYRRFWTDPTADAAGTSP